MRHPSELGLLLFGAGITVIALGWPVVLMLAIGVLLGALRLRREHAELRRVYGDTYARYAATTGLLLPGTRESSKELGG